MLGWAEVCKSKVGRWAPGRWWWWCLVGVGSSSGGGGGMVIEVRGGGEREIPNSEGRCK